MFSLQEMDDCWRAIEAKQVVIRPEFWKEWDDSFVKNFDRLESLVQENLHQPLPVNKALVLNACLNAMEHTVKMISVDPDGFVSSLQPLAVPQQVHHLMRSTLKNFLYKAYLLSDEWSSGVDTSDLFVKVIAETRAFLERLRKS